ncbi:MAG: MFS transporter [Thaumarchaeota archaeon]|jgi:MFS family permease|nr:MFS transporter [Candidatus Geocrenenecus arthurdayi]MCL7388899.1 MFS transporter [Candidatus Geocrenenecus arthurdayi]MCL7390637.1 MFS transporter [Candidatus Geocrenenecus arthurdayi]MCL7395890.1 MFS transporter [Candidatus Geocrenenecus arthurdayi]MCL7403611.1 MFS transporter [Candidatus Geocrenenecus arthurdayi]
MNRDRDHWVEKALYSKALLESIHYGASSPFIPIYGIELGASSIEVGILYALSNLSLNFFQLLWGYVSHKIKRFVFFIILGGIFSAIIMISLLFVKYIMGFIVLVILHSIASSMSIPTFIAYSSQVISEDRWRRFSENINSLNYLGWVAATLSVGLSSFFGLNGFTVGFLIAASSTFIGSIIVLIFCEEPDIDTKNAYPASLKNLKIRRHGKFFNFLVLSTAFGFFLSMAWPLFTITLTKISMLSLFEISLLDIVFGLSGAVGLALLRERFSLVKTSIILTLSSSSMALIPLVYALAPQLPFLILINILVGVFSVFYDAASLTYLLEKTPMEEKGFYAAVYNLSLGLAFFTGSMVAGYALGLLQHLWPLDYALTFLYIIIAVGRLIFGLLYRHLD